MKLLHAVALVGISTFLVTGCAQPPGGEEEELVIVPLGKEDNFFSNVAKEYLATAQVAITLEASYKDKTAAEQLARARTIMEGKTKQIAWFLHVYVIDKSDDDDAGDYGGLRAMVLDGSHDGDALKQDQDDPLTFSYTFEVQVGGSNELMDKIRAANNLPADGDTFPLRMAKLDNSKLINFSHGGYGAGDWSPDKCNCDLETLDVKLTAIDASKDAYLDYTKLLADKVIDISVHVGWDYHARYDITHSRQLYAWLTSTMGFTSPAKSYEAYSRLSGPLTKTITVEGEAVEARVSIFRPDPCEAWDEDGSYGAWAKKVKEDDANKKRACPDWSWDDAKANANPTTDAGAGNLMTDLKESLKTRDVVIFTGHSGYTYGYALASWYKTSKGDLDPPEIKTLPLPKDKSQIYVMSGCDTYHVGQAFKDNPNKAGLSNLDVITTTSFSNAGSVGDTKDLIRALVGTQSGDYPAVSYGEVMQNLNPSSYDYGHFFTMYGVHGIDDNPQLNPFADATKTCGVCTEKADCGAGGNVCVRLNSQEKICAAECLHDDACAADQVCRQFSGSLSGYIRGRACVPKSLSCNVAPPPPPQGKSFSASGQLGRDEEATHSVAVGSDAKKIKVVMTGTNDADLYTQFDKAPTKSDYSCRPYKNGSDETCSHATSDGTTLEILVRGYSTDKSSYTLQVTWE